MFFNTFWLYFEKTHVLFDDHSNIYRFFTVPVNTVSPKCFNLVKSIFFIKISVFPSYLIRQNKILTSKKSASIVN